MLDKPPRSTAEIQAEFLQGLAAREQWSRGELIQNLQTAFQCSRSSVYNRLNGSTPLVLPELITLAKTYDYHYQDATVAAAAEESPLSLSAQVGAIAQDLMAAKQAGDQVLFATTEIPVFYLFELPELCALKYYFWNRFGWENDRVDKQFDLRQLMLLPQVQQLPALWKLYADNHSSEIWTTNILDNVLMQIRYLVQNNYLKHVGDLILLQRVLHRFIDYLQRYTQLGKKAAGTLEVFDNEFSSTNNFLLWKRPSHSVAYLGGSSLGIYKSHDPQLVNRLLRDYSNQLRHCQPLTASSERDRDRFFGTVRKKVEQALEGL